VMYRMLTGKSPFQDANQDTRALLAAVVVHDLKPLDELEKQIPRPVAALMLELLSPDPEKRPKDARILIERIEALQRGETAMPDMASLLSVTNRPHTHHRLSHWAWAGIAVIALTLAIGVVVGVQRVFLSGDEPAKKIAPK